MQRPAFRQVCHRAGLVIALAAAPAQAVEIDLLFDLQRTATYAPGGNDQTLALIPIFIAAADRWEDLLHDNHTILIRFYWGDGGGDPEACVTEVDLFGRPTEARIIIRNDINWFIDSSPADDDEFDMAPKLYRDMHAVEQPDAFTGSVPDVFEVGFNGPGPSQDLLSIVMHEMGHALGLLPHDNSPPCGAPNTQCIADLDYDLTPAWVGGQVMAVRAWHSGGNSDCAHLAAGGIAACNDDPECESYQALMWTGPLPNRRQLPSAADVLAIALRSNFSQIDLQNKFRLPGISLWTTTSDWIGARTPDSGDNVYVISEDGFSSATINATDAFAMNLTIGAGNTVGVFGNNSLLVGNQVDVLDADSQLRVNDAGSFLSAVRIRVDPAAELQGAGLIETDRLFSGGIIRGLNNGELRIESDYPAGAFDLDGNPSDFVFATLDASGGDITLMGNWLDTSFDGVVNVASNRTLTIDHSVRFAATVNLNGLTGPATVAGPCTLDAVITVDGEGRFTGEAIYDGAWLLVPDEDDRLEMAGVTRYRGGIFQGDGVLAQTGNAFVEDDCVLDVAVFDWDGGNANSVTTIQPGRMFTINAGKIEDSLLADGHDGSINLLGADLVVNTSGAWRVDGTMFVNIPVGALSTVSGSNMDVLGLLWVDGEAVFDAKTDLLAGGELRTFDAGSRAVLAAPADNLMALGSSVTGPGILQVASGSRLIGAGTIASTLQVNGEARANGGQLTVSGPVSLTGVIGTESNTGVLHVTSNWSTGPGELNLRQGTVSGGNIDCPGRLTGEGAVDVNSVLVTGLIGPSAFPADATDVLIITGNLVLGAAAETQIHIGGTSQGQNYDLIRVFQSAHLAGTLRVALSDGFMPSCGQTFDVMTYSSRTGAFNNMTGLNLGTLRFHVEQANTFVRLRVVPQGDLDGNGSVDLADLGLVLSDYGCAAGLGQCPGDLNESGTTDLADLGAILAGWGMSCPN